MAEWSIAAVLKTVEGHTSGGSNPSLSAINAENQRITTPTPNFTPKSAKLGVFIIINARSGPRLSTACPQYCEHLPQWLLCYAAPKVTPNSDPSKFFLFFAQPRLYIDFGLVGHI